MQKKILIDLKNITIKLSDTFLLPDTSFSVHKGDNFVVTGENGSGKTSLMKVLTSEIPVCRGSIFRNHKLPLSKNIAYLSFENLKKILKKEALTEEAEYYSGKLLKKDALEHFLSNDDSVFKQTNLKSKKITDLSSGELRKFQIIKALENKPEILILDEPFDGLDSGSEKKLKLLISSLSFSDTVLFLVTHKPEDIELEKFMHIHVSGNKVEFYKKYQWNLNLKKHLPDLGKFVYHKKKFNPEIIADIKNADVFYDDRIILKNINFSISSGENGCGKSTLLSLITGDHLQSYSNKIEIFGKKRGTGESLWDIKEKIGFVSPDFHLKYNKDIETYKVLLSGYFDFVGLYQKPDEKQIKNACFILNEFGLSDLYSRNFNKLSYGQQRLILILRSLIKNPELIIMDEPCHGLDKYHRELVLKIVRTICLIKHKALVYVTHSDDELNFEYDYIFEFYKEKSELNYKTRIKNSIN